MASNASSTAWIPGSAGVGVGRCRGVSTPVCEAGTGVRDGTTVPVAGSVLPGPLPVTPVPPADEEAPEEGPVLTGSSEQALRPATSSAEARASEIGPVGNLSGSVLLGT